MVYIPRPCRVSRSASFDDWMVNLDDRQARARIAARIDRLALGNPGDCKAIGSGISELRIDHGPGYRVYFTKRGPEVIVILCGGNKRTQAADIQQARAIAQDWEP
jgi:putative addiction module killer protein